jgi:hypothetical protein
MTARRIKGREMVGFQSGGGSNTQLFVISHFTVSQKVRVQRKRALKRSRLGALQGCHYARDRQG